MQWGQPGRSGSAAWSWRLRDKAGSTVLGKERENEPSLSHREKVPGPGWGRAHPPVSTVELQQDLAPATPFPSITRALTPVTKEPINQMVPFRGAAGTHHLAGLWHQCFCPPCRGQQGWGSMRARSPKVGITASTSPTPSLYLVPSGRAGRTGTRAVVGRAPPAGVERQRGGSQTPRSKREPWALWDDQGALELPGGERKGSLIQGEAGTCPLCLTHGDQGSRADSLGGGVGARVWVKKAESQTKASPCLQADYWGQKEHHRSSTTEEGTVWVKCPRRALLLKLTPSSAPRGQAWQVDQSARPIQKGFGPQECRRHGWVAEDPPTEATGLRACIRGDRRSMRPSCPSARRPWGGSRGGWQRQSLKPGCSPPPADAHDGSCLGGDPVLR